MTAEKLPTSERIAKIFDAVLHDEPAALARYFIGHEKLAACVNAHKQTPLLLAASVGASECVSILLPHSDASLRDGPDGKGRTALMLLADGRRPGHARCAQLLAPVCDANAQSHPKGETALMMAIQQERRETIKALLPFSDPAVKDRAGATALEWAVRVRNVSAVLLLAPISPRENPRNPQGSNSSSFDSNNPHGQSLLTRAIRQSSDLRVIEALLPLYDAKERGLIGGQTPLTAAMGMNRLDIATLLLPHSDRTAKVSNGRNAFSIAAHAGFVEGMALLAASMSDEEAAAEILQCESDLGCEPIKKTPLPQPALDWMGQTMAAIEARALSGAMLPGSPRPSDADSRTVVSAEANSPVWTRRTPRAL